MTMGDQAQVIRCAYIALPFASNALWLVAIAFWAWMLYDCIRHEPERDTWLWVVILLNLPGAVIYFFVRYLPRLKVAPPPFLGRWMRRRELWRAEAATRNIGNPHQFVELGDILRETGQFARAAEAYQQALEEDPTNAQALWGVALVEVKTKRLDRARDCLQALLEVDPDYKLGDASLAYARTLLELKDLEAAKAHVEEHLHPSTNPEARILLAAILGEQGEPEKARALLEPLVEDLKPARDAASRGLRRKASRLLRRLGR